MCCWVWPLSPAAMSLDGLQARCEKAVTQLGSMLFTRQVSGARYENFIKGMATSWRGMEWMERGGRRGVGVIGRKLREMEGESTHHFSQKWVRVLKKKKPRG